MEYKVLGDTVAVRLQKGEELMASLMALCEKESILLGEISGLGAVNEVSAGVLDAPNKQYVQNQWNETLELTSLTGSVTVKDKKPYLHLHGTFARLDGQVVGGHVNRAVISGTGEIFIRRLPGEIGRAYDDETGLNLMVLK